MFGGTLQLKLFYNSMWSHYFVHLFSQERIPPFFTASSWVANHQHDPSDHICLQQWSLLSHFERIPHNFGFHMSGRRLKNLQAFKRAVHNTWLSDLKVALITNTGLSTWCGQHLLIQPFAQPFSKVLFQLHNKVCWRTNRIFHIFSLSECNGALIPAAGSN